MAKDTMKEAPKKVEPVAELDPNRLVIIEVPFPCYINGVKFEGKCTVEHHVSEVLVEMIQKKMQQDLNAISDGKVKQYVKVGTRIIVQEVGSTTKK